MVRGLERFSGPGPTYLEGPEDRPDQDETPGVVRGPTTDKTEKGTFQWRDPFLYTRESQNRGPGPPVGTPCGVDRRGPGWASTRRALVGRLFGNPRPPRVTSVYGPASGSDVLQKVERGSWGR